MENDNKIDGVTTYQSDLVSHVNVNLAKVQHQPFVRPGDIPDGYHVVLLANQLDPIENGPKVVTQEVYDLLRRNIRP